MRRTVAAFFAILFIAGTLALLPLTTQLSAQEECTGPDCPAPGGHQCEREREAPTA